MPSDYDSAWKEALHRYLQLALELLFPNIADAIDWSKGHEFLDTELRQIFPDAEAPDRQADVLVKVTLSSGQESWILLHAEVQNQRDESFAKRMYTYHYRLTDRYQRSVCSLAILGDDNENWRPRYYGTNTLGCKIRFDFPTVKFLDFSPEELQKHPNPFALVVLAQLYANKAPFGSKERVAQLFALARQLHERGLSADEIRSFFELIDWVLKLTPQQALQFREDLANYEKENNVPHISSIQQIGLEQGVRNSIKLVLESRFGTLPSELEQGLSEASADSLTTLTRYAATSSSLQEFVEHLDQK